MNAWNRFWFTPAPASTLGLCRALFFLGLCAWQFPRDYAPWAGYLLCILVSHPAVRGICTCPCSRSRA